MVIQAADLRSTKHSDPKTRTPREVTGCTVKAAMSSIKDKTLTWSRDVQGVTRCAPVTSSVIKPHKYRWNNPSGAHMCRGGGGDSYSN